MKQKRDENVSKLNNEKYTIFNDIAITLSCSFSKNEKKKNSFCFLFSLDLKY